MTSLPSPLPHLPQTKHRPSHLAAALTPGLAAVLLLFGPPLQAQKPSSSSSSSSSSPASISSGTPAQKIAQPDAGGSAVTLETSEPLFDLAAALNLCGYDSDLSDSSPVRALIRQEIQDAVTASPEAAPKRDTLCQEIRQHQLADPGRNIAQYVSLSLYLSPDLTPIVDETELPPDSTQVVPVLPALRAFSEAIHLHAIWVAHHPDYEALVARLHDPLTQMILGTDIYLRSSLSSYDGRRFLVLVEPMLAPSSVNARIYSSNYVVVVSPSAGGAFHMDQIRHTYLHYQIEPMVYARAAAMDRLLPLLKPVQEAPVDFIYKSDIVALLTECLIKAVEARTMNTGIAMPPKVTSKLRTDFEKHDAEMNLYNRQAKASAAAPSISPCGRAGSSPTTSTASSSPWSATTSVSRTTSAPWSTAWMSIASVTPRRASPFSPRPPTTSSAASSPRPPACSSLKPE